MLNRSIEEALRAAVRAVVPDANVAAVQVRPSSDAKFGDYQSSAVMALAKERKTNPRQLATEIVGKLNVSAWCEKVEIAGPGFLNFRLKAAAIEQTLQTQQQSNHPFIQPSTHPRTVVIDFSSPNVAKPMHVGHIRSTILGDSLARTLRLLGHKVITDNHIGDWGTQFGMLIVGWKKHLNRAALETDPIAEMERLYKLVNSDPSAIEEARQELVKLQGGDPDNLVIWREMIRLSQSQFDTIYARLGIRFDHTLGESFYNPKLQGIVAELTQAGIAQESEGAKVIFFPDDPQLKETPAIIRKSDGGFNYTTTDLATLQHRLQTWNPDEVVYVTDGRQQLHFRQLFASFRRWHPDTKVKLAHVWFGSILGEDGKPFKTRAGETVKLADLLDEAEERALAVVTGKLREQNRELPQAQVREIARVVGVGAVKYADLLPNRQTDYVFSWDKMLALNGNTAPYLQYAYTRARSIFRKGEVQEAQGVIKLTEPAELTLAKQLLNFGLVLQAVAEEYRPNFLCNYLYDLAGHFTVFYEACQVLKAPPGVRESRLALVDLTGRILKQGLDVLGIQTLEQM